MATLYWLGIALARAQIATVTVSGYDAATTYFLEVNGVRVAVGSGGGTTTTVAAALVAAWNASTHAYATGITASNAANVITLTADVAGVPFTVVSGVSGGAGTIGAFTITTAATGKEHWNDPDNWSTGAVPVSSDDVIIGDSSVPILWGLDQNAVALASLTVRQSYTGKIGLPFSTFATSADGATTAAVTEYRQDYLLIGADRVSLGEHDGPGDPNGAGRIKLNNNRAAASTTVVHRTTASGTDLGLPAVRLRIAHASATLEVRRAQGGVGVAIEKPGETSTVGTISVVDPSTVSRVFVGDGVTLTNWRQQGGRNLLQGAATITSAVVAGGELVIEGTAAVTTLTVSGPGATVEANNKPAAGSALGTVTVSDGAELIGTGSTATRTWGTVKVTEGALEVDDAIVTVTTYQLPSGRRRVTVTR